MKYKIKFSGEFEADMGPGRMTDAELEKARQSVVALNPIMNAPGAYLDISPVVKAYKVAYRDMMMNYEIVEASNLVEASKIFMDRHFQTCMIEEIEEVK